MINNQFTYYCDPKKELTFEEKVLSFAKAYLARFGIYPNVCQVNPKMIKEAEDRSRKLGVPILETEKIIYVSSIEIILNKSVLPNNFYLGVKKDNTVLSKV